MEFKRRLPIPMEIREAMPLSLEMARRKEAFDAQVAAVIRGEDRRVLLIIGPCSADREDSVLDYVTRLAALQERVADKILMIPRVYTNKPRTNGTGYKGLLHNPDPGGRAGPPGGREGHPPHAPARG
jgi:3-deoxy-7-phosphoheptulonate synthase